MKDISFYQIRICKAETLGEIVKRCQSYFGTLDVVIKPSGEVLLNGVLKANVCVFFTSGKPELLQR